VIKLAPVRWPVDVQIRYCCVVMQNADCSVLLPYLVVGGYSVRCVHSCYNVCGIADPLNLPQVGRRTEGLADSNHSVCCNLQQKPITSAIKLATSPATFVQMLSYRS